MRPAPVPAPVPVPVLLVALLLATPTTAAADPRPRPHLLPSSLPFRPRMTMRTPPPAPSPSPSTTTGSSTGTGSGTGTTTDADAAAEPIDPLRFDSSQVARRRARTARPGQEPVVRAQITSGFALDGASPSTSGARTLAGLPVADGSVDLAGFARARAYGFGALYLGGRNLVVPGLGGYLAARTTLRPSIPDIAPVATAWDQTDSVHLGAAWAEAAQVFATPVLRPLSLRAGRQYVYGPFVAHLDGLHVRWRHAWFDASVYAGSRVPAWSARADAPRGLDPQRGPITGAEVTLDLRRTAIAMKVRLRALAYEDHGHADLTVDSRVRTSLDVTAIARTFDGAIANEHVTARYRLSDRTRLVLDAGYRHRRDPLWDLAYLEADDVTAARRYLDLGPNLPRANLRVRAGTVLLDNVDLLLSGGAAYDASSSDPEDESLYAAGWIEGGGALEVRVRRTFALGLSGMARAYSRRDPVIDDLVIDEENLVQPLVLLPEHTGERSLIEGGLSARFSGGARTFSVATELYARRVTYAEQYRDDGDQLTGDQDPDDVEDRDPIEQRTFRGGGRIRLDAWVTERVRVRCEYDLTTQLELAPEVRGVKSLRIVAEGTL